MYVCVAKPVAVELRCHATALILVIGKAQFRRAMLSCDSSCFFVVYFLSLVLVASQFCPPGLLIRVVAFHFFLFYDPHARVQKIFTGGSPSESELNPHVQC